MNNSQTANGTTTSTAFLVWVVIIGVLIPAAILGGLNLYGFQFVFKSR
jgi:hypothetical protein